jgi:hypothetical protein
MLAIASVTAAQKSGEGRRLHRGASRSRHRVVPIEVRELPRAQSLHRRLVLYELCRQAALGDVRRISDSMPEDNPGSLEERRVRDVIAYLLKLNNFPAGESNLPTDKDALSAILMEKPIDRQSGSQAVRPSAIGRRAIARNAVATAALQSPNTTTPIAPHGHS